MQVYNATGVYFKKNSNPYFYLLPVFIKQELDYLEIKLTELKSAKSAAEIHQQSSKSIHTRV